MDRDHAHIRLKLETSQPIALSDFVGTFVGLGNQFEKFVAREYPDLKAGCQFFIEEVRSGSIEADLVAWVVSSGAIGYAGYTLTAVDVVEKVQVLTSFVQSVKRRLGSYFGAGGRADDANTSDLNDFLKTTAAIANDENGSAKIEAAYSMMETGR